MMLKDERQKGKITYKIWDIVVVTVLAVLADCTNPDKIAVAFPFEFFIILSTTNIISLLYDFLATISPLFIYIIPPLYCIYCYIIFYVTLC